MGWGALRTTAHLPQSPGCVEVPERYHAERARQDDSKLLIDQLRQLAAAVIDGDGVGTIHETRINESRSRLACS